MSAPRNTLAQRRRPRLQISLRALLALFTLVAVGFPIWYRWPYTEVEIRPPKPNPPMFTIETTWRRTWGGGREMHGPQTRATTDRVSRVVTHYANNIRNGPHVEYVNRAAIVTGQYASGRETGQWVRVSRDGEFRVTWKDGLRHGLTEFRPRGGSVLALDFDEGSLIQVNGQPLPRSWSDVKAEISRDSPKLASCLAANSIAEFKQTPLKHAVEIISDNHAIPGLLRVDSSKIDANLPITVNISDIDLFSILVVLAGSYDLGCDYRYGCLWITSPEDAVNWTDPTGISRIVPSSGSALSAAWSEPVFASTFIRGRDGQPLAKVVQSLATQLGIEIDTTLVEPAENRPESISFHMNGHPFHETLGILLYETGCRCRLEGERLVILPPENLTTARE